MLLLFLFGHARAGVADNAAVVHVHVHADLKGDVDVTVDVGVSGGLIRGKLSWKRTTPPV